MKFDANNPFASLPEFAPLPENTPKLRKRGGGWKIDGGGWWAHWTMENAAQLWGKRKKTQMRMICEAFGLCPEWVAQFDWTVRRSKNLYYHPNTYSLDITHRN